MASDLISYEEIRRVQTQERENKSLQEIDASFFEKVREYIKEKKRLIEENKGKENVFSEQKKKKNEQELRNVKRIIDDICSRRRRKIVTQALNNISAKVHNTENMLPEEELLYNEVIEVVKKYSNSFMSKFKESAGDLDKKEEGKDLKKLKLMESIPQFLWKDGNKYGPFEKDAVTELPEELGEILINEGKAIEFSD